MTSSEKKILAERFAKDATTKLILGDLKDALNDIKVALTLRPKNKIYKNIKIDILDKMKN